MLFQTLIHHSVGVILALAINSVPAVSAPSVARSPAAPVSSSAANDPRVIQLLQQMFDAEVGLNSFSGVLTMKGTGHLPSMYGITTIKMYISFMKPNLLAMTSNNGERTARVVCDGVHVFSMIVGAATYRKDVAPANLEQVVNLAHNTVAEADFLSLFFIKASANMKLFMESNYAFSLEGSGKLDGVPVRLISARFRAKPAARMILAVGAADHLLRRATTTIDSPPTEAGSLTSAMSEVKINPKLSKASFTFIPPKGGAAEPRAIAPGDFPGAVQNKGHR